MKILLVEDEPQLAGTVADYLKTEGYRCELAPDFITALDKISSFDYDCVLLDISLPGGDGLTLLRKLKELHKSNGVIIISAKNSIDDKVAGLNLGADDYLAKPFHMAELMARLQAVLRRRRFDGHDVMQFEAIRLDTLAKTVCVHDQPVVVTRKEFDLLLFLMSNCNRVVSKEAIAEHLSGDHADMMDSFDFIYTHMKNLKKKLGDAGCPDYIKSIYGLGYKLSV